MNIIRLLIVCVVGWISFSVTATTPKMEGRFIELQDTYVSPIWTQINFQQSYEQPPAVFMLSTNQGGNPAIVRIRNVTTTSFEALPLEPSGEDGEHVTMGAHYLAIEYGVHEFPDGSIMEVGKTQLKDELKYGAGSTFILPQKYKALSFAHTFAVRPNFFHSLQTLNSVDTNPPSGALIPFFTIAVNTGSLTATGVDVALEASETKAGNVKAETMAYLVVKPGANRSFIDDNDNEVIWESFFTGFKVDGWSDGCNNFNFTNNYTDDPLVMASNNSREGDDGGWLRSCRLDRNRLGLVVDEDRSADSERSHIEEEASILAMRGNFVVRADVLSCDELFPGAIATYNDKTITLVENVTVTDNNNAVLTTSKLSIPALTNPPLCNGQACVASGTNSITALQAADLPTIDNDGSSTGDLPTTLAGDYFYDQSLLTMVNSTYTVVAPTRIFLKDSSGLLSGVDTKSFLSIANAPIVIENGAYLAIYVDGSVTIGAGIDFTAFLVATEDVNIGDGVDYSGAINAGGNIITAQTSNPENALGVDFVALPRPSSIPGLCGVDIPIVLDHYRLEMSDNKGLTCEPKSLTLKACANDNCDELYDQVASLDLSPDNNNEQSWPQGENLSFTATEDISFAKRTTGQVQFGYNTADPSAPLRCYIGGNNVGLGGCKVNFSDAGFIIKNDTDNDTVIPYQISGKPSDTGFNAKQLSIQAVKTNTTTGACEAAFEDGQQASIDLAYTCGAGMTCSDDLQLQNANNTHSISQAYKPFNITFDAEAKAPIVLTYPNAGQISLAVKAKVVLDATTGLSSNLSGSSNLFVVKPFALALSFLSGDNPFATGANGSLFRLTGEPFSLVMNAVQWLSGQDTNYDGMPDNLGQVASNPIAKHFTGEAPKVTAKSLVAPAAGELGALSEESIVPFTDTGNLSESRSQFSYDQVGIIKLKAALADGDYLGTGNVNGEITNVGRFSPSHYTVSNIQAQAKCTAYGSNLTYLSEPFDLAFTVQAENHNGEIMKNYRDGFIKSNVEVNAENNEIGNYISASALTPRLDGIAATGWSNTNHGLWQLNTNVANLARRAFNDPDGPFESVNLMATLAGLEGATLVAANDNPELQGNCGVNCNSVRLNTTPISFRFGRLQLGNNAGPDLDNLFVPMEAQYYDGSGFVRNQADNCTAFEHPQITQLSPNSPVLEYIYGTGSSGLFENGSYPINNAIYAKPQGAGIFNIQYNALPWLEWDWQGDGSQLNPQGTLQFGQFRGNDRIIYWREVRE